MRTLAWIVALLVVLYGGFWFVASSRLRTEAEATLQGLQADGRADYRGLSVSGFPSRLDLTIDQPRLVAADGLATWSAPFVQIFALAYRPNQIIAVWPHDQTLTTPAGDVTLSTSDMRASALFGASLNLPLDHATLIARDGKVVSDAGWSAGFSEARFGTRLAGQADAHDLGVEILGIDTGPLTPDPGLARLDGTAAFDRPIDRSSGTPRLLSLDLREARLAFGTAALGVSGKLAVSPDGFPEGRLTLVAEHWREVLRLLTAVGAVRPEVAPTWENMFTNLTATTADPDRLEIPLTLASGRMSIGPLPLGFLPRLPGY